MVNKWQVLALHELWPMHMLFRACKVQKTWQQTSDQSATQDKGNACNRAPWVVWWHPQRWRHRQREPLHQQSMHQRPNKHKLSESAVWIEQLLDVLRTLIKLQKLSTFKLMPVYCTRYLTQLSVHSDMKGHVGARVGRINPLRPRWCRSCLMT